MAISTGAERRLTTQARRLFGKHLTLFLLDGFNEDEVVRSRTFVVRLGGTGTEESYRLRLIADDALGLPRKEQPLMLLALLRLLLTKGADPLGKVTYDYQEIAGICGAEDVNDFPAVVDGAIDRYFNLSYQRTINAGEGNGDASPNRTRTDRFLIRYESADESVDNCSTAAIMQRSVSFNLDFFEELRNRSLFGIDWRRVRSLESLPPDGA
jgi:hypothetical protein